MQGLSSYANNIMGHTMNQYAAQSSLLSTQVIVSTRLLFFKTNPCWSITITITISRYLRWTTTSQRREEEAFQAQEGPRHQRRRMQWQDRLLVKLRCLLICSWSLHIEAKDKVNCNVQLLMSQVLLVHLSLQRHPRQPLARHLHSLGKSGGIGYFSKTLENI